MEARCASTSRWTPCGPSCPPQVLKRIDGLLDDTDSVEAMTTDQLTAAQKAASELFPGFWKGRGWGFGVSLLLRRDDAGAVSARFG